MNRFIADAIPAAAPRSSRLQEHQSRISKPLTTGEFHRLHGLLREMIEEVMGPFYVMPQAMTPGLEPKTISRAEEQWLELLERAVSLDAFRRYLERKTIADEQSLELLIRFVVSRKTHAPADMRKVEWMLTHLFRMREEQSNRPGWHEQEIEALVAGDEPKALSRHAEDLLAEFPPLLDEIKRAERFSELTESRVILRGRELKGRFGEEFFHSKVLAAIVNYNLILKRKFQTLFEKAVHRLPQTEELRETIATNPDELLGAEYQETISTLWRLGELESESEAEPSPRHPLEADLEAVDRQMTQLGIDTTRQAQSVREKTRELSLRLQNSSPATSSVSTPFGTLLLAEWEANALRQSRVELEDTFRGQFARNIAFALGLILRIQEEVQAYYETKGTAHLWKSHCQALFYLRHEGQAHGKLLEELATDCRNRGLLQKADQISQTAAKLETALARIGNLAGPPWLLERSRN
jgi:hypothetical protein